PTEAEWEYVARAGSDTVYSFGDDAAQLAEYGWYRENSEYQMHAVGELQPNAWGIYDMYGNAWEWCQDWYGESYYAESPKDKPQGPAEGEEKVSRGCAAPIGADECRSSNRNYLEPDSKNPATGFRVVVTAPLP
uniref:formylglycine-generating enzyme family protein n=1 Tax=Sedimenticola sp. TaxID=1940285 RepID=UPI003D09917A